MLEMALVFQLSLSSSSILLKAFLIELVKASGICSSSSMPETIISGISP